MINEEILKNFNGNKIIYSPYGYILINKEDYDNPEKKIINFTGINKEKLYQNPLLGSIIKNIIWKTHNIYIWNKSRRQNKYYIKKININRRKWQINRRKKSKI